MCIYEKFCIYVAPKDIHFSILGFMSMNVLPDNMYLYHMYTVSMEARKGYQFSKTVIIDIVSHHTGTENQTQVL